MRYIEPVMECNICIEKFNYSNHKHVLCACGYNACRICVRTYLLNSFLDAHCMNCKVEWDRAFMVEMLGCRWVNSDYKTHYENILFTKEQSLLQLAQMEIEKRNKIKELVRKKSSINRELGEIVRPLYRTIDEIKGRIIDLKNDKRAAASIKNGAGVIIKSVSKVKAEIQVGIVDLKSQLSETHGFIKEFQQNFNDRIQVIDLVIHGMQNSGTELSKEYFTRRCPNNGCKGFLSKDMKCSICMMWSCDKCFEVKGVNQDDEHKCDPSVVETIQFIEKDTKPCPSCGTMIFKINGCDQMWCTECKTAFSWATGQVEKGRIHNPHYNEYRRQIGVIEREQGDIICGRDIDDLNTYRTRYWNPKYIDIIKNIRLINRTIHAHTRAINNTNNLELRIKYLLHEITEAGFKKAIQRVDKMIKKKRWEREILQTYVYCMTELLFRINDNYAHCMEIYDEMCALRNLTNRYLSKIGESFQSRTLMINMNFELSSY